MDISINKGSGIDCRSRGEGAIISDINNPFLEDDELEKEAFAFVGLSSRDNEQGKSSVYEHANDKQSSSNSEWSGVFVGASDVVLHKDSVDDLFAAHSSACGSATGANKRPLESKEIIDAREQQPGCSHWDDQQVPVLRKRQRVVEENQTIDQPIKPDGVHYIRVINTSNILNIYKGLASFCYGTLNAWHTPEYQEEVQSIHKHIQRTIALLHEIESIENKNADIIFSYQQRISPDQQHNKPEMFWNSGETPYDVIESGIPVEGYPYIVPNLDLPDIINMHNDNIRRQMGMDNKIKLVDRYLGPNGSVITKAVMDIYNELVKIDIIYNSMQLMAKKSELCKQLFFSDRNDRCWRPNSMKASLHEVLSSKCTNIGFAAHLQQDACAVELSNLMSFNCIKYVQDHMERRCVEGETGKRHISTFVLIVVSKILEVIDFYPNSEVSAYMSSSLSPAFRGYINNLLTDAFKSCRRTSGLDPRARLEIVGIFRSIKFICNQLKEDAQSRQMEDRIPSIVAWGEKPFMENKELMYGVYSAMLHSVESMGKSSVYMKLPDFAIDHIKRFISALLSGRFRGAQYLKLLSDIDMNTILYNTNQICKITAQSLMKLYILYIKDEMA